MLYAPADVVLTRDDAAFLAARLRRLFAHHGYKLPDFASDDASLIRIAGSCIGSVLQNAARVPDGESADLAQVLDALRLGRVACEWHGNQQDADKITKAMDAARALAASGVNPRAEHLWLTVDDVMRIVGANESRQDIERALIANLPSNGGPRPHLHGSDTDQALPPLPESAYPPDAKPLPVGAER